MSVRVRYAPSPTGSPHVGNIRTALFDDLFARGHQGVMIVRIEDTDRARAVPGAEEEILESLRYVGIEWQEGPDVGGPCGPYRQSERKEAGHYEPYITRLLETGAAYKAFETPEELAVMREFQQANKLPPGYFGGSWRDASPAKVREAEAAGSRPVIRLRIPRDERVVVNDGIRGPVQVDSNTLDDIVLIKADGMPTYHFAAMVDDYLMGITHVFRGEEWISSAPKHLLLLRALGWEPPVWVHVPVIKGKDGAKLSKRHGDTSCLDFRRAGTLGEALANFIALIGWSPGGDREIMSHREMAEAFEISGIQPSPGVFDLDKLHWMSGQYLRALPFEELTARVQNYAASSEAADYWRSHRPEVADGLARLAEAFPSDRETAVAAIALERERVVDLAGFAEACEFFFVDEVAIDPKAAEKWLIQPHVPAMFHAMIEALRARTSASVEECETLLRDYAQANGFEKLGPIVHPTRVALTGRTAGPGLFELMSVLGPERIVRRLERVLASFGTRDG